MIFTVTLNPAVDKIIFLDEFIPARTARINKTLDTLGGKGTHVSIDLKLLNIENTALGVTLGENGKRITQMMEEWGVSVRFLHYDAPGLESRTNFEIIEEKGSRCTMLSSRGPMLTRAMTDDLLAQIKTLASPKDILMLTGDASNVEDTSVYTRLAEEAHDMGVKVILDASGPYLKEGLKSKPYMIKPNFEELCFIAGRELKGEADVVSVLEELDKAGIEVVAMTWSDQGAVVKSGKSIWRVYPAKVRAVNEAGCGDAFLSAVVAGLVRGDDLEQTIKWAACVAGAAAESEITTGFDMGRAQELMKTARAIRLK
jgi:1-phosphofructokinase family hexose kinase